jgi:hypothetical protein
MKFANATKFDRKSGVAQRRDLQFHLRAQRMCRGRITSGVPLRHQHKLQIPPLRYAPVGMTKSRVALHLGSGGGGWTESTNKGPDTYPDCPLTLSIDYRPRS